MPPNVTDARMLFRHVQDHSDGRFGLAMVEHALGQCPDLLRDGEAIRGLLCVEFHGNH